MLQGVCFVAIAWLDNLTGKLSVKMKNTATLGTSKLVVDPFKINWCTFLYFLIALQ